MSNWKREEIATKREKQLREQNLTHEQLVERVVALETALYPFAYVLGSLDSDTQRGTEVTSKLFPFNDGEKEDKFIVYVKEDGSEKEIDRNTVSENELHSLNYYTEDSLTLMKGTLLDDKFSIIGVHQSAIGGSINCGDICMGDVRHAVQLLFPKPPQADESPG